jgi:phage tail-like protein
MREAEMEARRILRYLPENYQFAAANQSGVMNAMLQVMDGMHAPVDRVLRSIDCFFDPFRAPDAFVLLQASWLGLDRYFDWSGGTAGVGEARYTAGTDQLRLLIAEFPGLVRSRGTHVSLTRFLEAATGVKGFIVEDGAPTGGAFHITVHVPPQAAALDDLVRRIIAGERPAHATWEIQMIEDHPGDQKE